MALGPHALTTVARFRTYWTASSTINADQDPVLELLIDSASERIEGACDRHFEKATYTDDLYLTRGGRDLYLRQWPINSITKVEESADGGASWTVVLATEYAINRTLSGIYRRLGWLDGRAAVGLSRLPLADGPYNARITYVAGYKTPGGTAASPPEVALPSDLEAACWEWVADVWMHRDKAGLASENVSGGETSLGTVFQDLPPRVARAIARYQRLRV